MKPVSGVLLLFFVFSVLFSCTSYPVPENLKYNYSINGPLTDDVFQVIIYGKPSADSLTQLEQRESSFMSAKSMLKDECVNQIMTFYCKESGTVESLLTPEKISSLKTRFHEIASRAVVEQEYYLHDNSVVFVVRIYSTGLKSKILNN